MRFKNLAGMRAATVLFALVLGALASCGGDIAINTARGIPPGTAPQPPAPAMSRIGRLTVIVTDPDGSPLSGAQVAVYNSSQPELIDAQIVANWRRCDHQQPA